MEKSEKTIKILQKATKTITSHADHTCDACTRTMILTEIQKILGNLTEQRKPSRLKRQLSVVKPNAPKGQLNRFPVRGVAGPSDWPLYRGYIKTIVAK